MRIVDVAEFYAEAGGGVKTYIDAKLAAGAAHGHEIVVIAPGPEDKEISRKGGRVIWVQSPTVPGDARYHLFFSKKKVQRVLDRVQPDVIEGSSPYGGAWFASGWTGDAVKSFVFHQDPVAALAHPLLDKWIPASQLDRVASPVWSYLANVADRFDTTVVAGEWLAQRLTQFGLPRVTAVPFGIDPTPFKKATRSPPLRSLWLEKLGIDSTGTLLMAVSRHHPEKRLTVLIEAVKKLPKTYGLVIFGDGPARTQIERAAAKCPRVFLAGYTRDRAALAESLKSADIFVHASAAETFGLVVSEALAAGLPMVVPSAGGAAELAHPDFSETYPPGDASQCATAIQRLNQRPSKELAQAITLASGQIRTLEQHFEALFTHYASLMRQKAQLTAVET